MNSGKLKLELSCECFVDAVEGSSKHDSIYYLRWAPMIYTHTKTLLATIMKRRQIVKNGNETRRELVYRIVNLFRRRGVYIIVWVYYISIAS